MPCSFHMLLSFASTDGWAESTTGFFWVTIASKSARRKRQTRRWVPVSASAFTLPCRAQSRIVRVLTLRYCAASAAVSHVRRSAATRPSVTDSVEECSGSEGWDWGYILTPLG